MATAYDAMVVLYKQKNRTLYISISMAIIISIALILYISFYSGYTIDSTTISSSPNRRLPVRITHKNRHNHIIFNQTLCQSPNFKHKDNHLLRDEGYWINLGSTPTINCSLNGSQNCVGPLLPFFDDHLQSYYIFRRKSCYYKLYSPENMFNCLTNRTILILGDSTAWELKNLFLNEFFKIMTGKRGRYIFRHISQKNNFSIYLHDKMTKNYVKVIVHEPYAANRQGLYFFLDEKYRKEIDDKYYNYYDIRVGANLNAKMKQAVNFKLRENMKILSMSINKWDKEFYNHSENMTSNEIREREMRIMDDLLMEADTVVLGMILHDIAFGKWFGFILNAWDGHQGVERLSFDWMEFRKNTLKNFWKYIDRFDNVKNKYYWTSQKPSKYLGDCKYLYEYYDIFHLVTLDVMWLGKYDVRLIDTHDTTFGRGNRFYGDSGGCHFGEGNTSDIVGRYFYQIFVNSLCN